MLLMQGPNIRQDELVHGAGLLDITPTVLHAMGLPIGRDMDGRPLLEVFESVKEVSTIESWESRTGKFSDGMHSGGIRRSAPKNLARFSINLLPWATSKRRTTTQTIR